MKHNQDKLSFLGIAMICLMALLAFCMFPAKTVQAATKISYLTAQYTESSQVVGTTIDTDKLTVTAYYEDGSSYVVTDYSLANNKILKADENVFTVVYLGKVAQFTVLGKTVSGISTFYTGGEVTVGNSVDVRLIECHVSYSDGSVEETTDFIVSGGVITKIGTNTIHIIYGGKQDTITVTGIAPKSVLSLTASYTGGSVTVGNTINQRDLTVIAVYTDASTETICNYTLSPATVTVVGTQTILVSFRGKTTTFTVTGESKKVASISAVYKGRDVAIGNSVKKADVEVTVTYNNGTTEKVTDFTLSGASIGYLGIHTVTVEYSGVTTQFTVTGVKEGATDFSNQFSMTISNGKASAKAAIALPSNVSSLSLTGKKISSSEVKGVMRKADAKAYYIAFEISVTDDYEFLEDYFPLTMQVSIPTQYKIEGCSIYYTPNRKSVIAKMNTEVVDGKLQCTVYKSGTYILAYSVQ
ncbi:MAG: hypothetical protein E7256_06960 [Lachnospiraceae bacterium]|nr:hypothetical protein [Lachnospiraceae bacterium]